MPNVKIKNYVGADCIYEDVDKVWLASEDSTDDNPDLLPYTYGEAEELTVDLSFPAVESSKVEVFPAQTVEGFYYSNSFGCFVTGITPAPFVPVLGDTYHVEWDGEQFDRTAFEFTAPDGASCIGIGNTIMSGVDSGEPFLVCYDVTNGYFYFFSTQQDASHEIAVYKVEGSGEGSAMVVVPTGKGKIISKVTIPKPDGLTPGNIKKGETVAGIPGEYEGETVELEEVTVALAMANGDQVIEPTEGKALGKVTLTKPETLVPENIAKDVNIAGIIGTLAAGGNIVVASGKVAGTGGAVTVNHNLGVIPDYIQVWLNIANSIVFANGFSSAFASKHLGAAASNRYVYNNNGTIKHENTFSGNIDTGNAPYINSANESTFNVGSSTYPMASGWSFNWIAIGGLT